MFLLLVYTQNKYNFSPIHTHLCMWTYSLNIEYEEIYVFTINVEYIYHVLDDMSDLRIVVAMLGGLIKTNPM